MTQQTNFTAMVSESDRHILHKQTMHKYVWICVSVWLLCVATFPLAYLRVSESEKYNGGPFKSLRWDESQKPN